MKPIPLTLLLLAYNDEKTIIAALKSILQQDFFKEKQPLELILLPNGCTDKTVELINNFFQSKTLPATLSWRSIVLPEAHRNKALNTGIREANGELVCYMNADCTISRGGLSAIVNSFKNDSNLRVVSLNDTPNLDHLLPNSLLKGYFEVQETIAKIKGKIVPVGRALAFRSGYIDSVPENIHSEDNWIGFITARKHGIASIRVIQNEHVYWTPPSDWATFINLMARYNRGTSQFFETFPEYLKIVKRLAGLLKRKTVDEIKDKVIEELVKSGKTRERAEELLEFHKNVVKIFAEQEKILGSSFVDKKGKWVTDR